MSKFEYSKEAAEAVKNFLTENDWKYQFDEEVGMFEMNLKIRARIQKIEYLISIEKKEIVMYGVAPIGVDPCDTERMAQMAEFICRANYGIKNGGFELDFRDGEIRYKCYVDCANLIPSDEVIRNGILCIGVMYEHYSEGILDVVIGGKSAAEALEENEEELPEGTFCGGEQDEEEVLPKGTFRSWED